jgi:hypothetical protein
MGERARRYWPLRRVRIPLPASVGPTTRGPGSAGPGTVLGVSPGDSESWQTDAPGPFVTLRAGGPLDGVVTITAIADGHGRTLVEAAWVQDGHAHSDSVEAETYESARVIAREAVDDLAAGPAPDFARD